MNRMKEEIDRELNELQADPEILERARSQGKRHGASSCGRRRRTAAAVCAAAVLALGGITVLASGVMEGFTQYFRGDLGKYHDQILQSAVHAENEDYAIAIDGVLSDERQCMFVFSIEALTRESTKELQRMLEEFRGFPDTEKDLIFTACLRDGTEETPKGSELFQYGDLQSDSFQTYVVTMDANDLDVKSLREVEYWTVSFGGLTLNAKPEVIMSSQPLTGQQPDPRIKDVTWSPIGFGFQSSDEEFEVWLISKDGTIDEEKAYGTGFFRENDGDWVNVKGDFRYEVMDLENYRGLRINGIDYVRQ